MSEPEATSLAAAYPDAARGAEMLVAYLHMSAEERTAWLQSVDAPEMVGGVYMPAVDMFTVTQDRIFPEIGRAVRDRWLSQGDARFEVALRAHHRETAASREQIAEAKRQCTAAMPVAQWFKDQKHKEAAAEDRERAAEATIAEANGERDRYKAAHRELRDRLAVGIVTPPPLVP